KFGDKLGPAEQKVDQARIALLSAYADQLQSGSVDDSALAPKVQSLLSAQLAARPVVNELLTTLHQTLDPQQRAKFADGLEQAIQSTTSPQAIDKSATALGMDQQRASQLR